MTSNLPGIRFWDRSFGTVGEITESGISDVCSLTTMAARDNGGDRGLFLTFKRSRSSRNSCSLALRRANLLILSWSTRRTSASLSSSAACIMVVVFVVVLVFECRPDGCGVSESNRLVNECFTKNESNQSTNHVDGEWHHTCRPNLAFRRQSVPAVGFLLETTVG